MYDKNKEMSVFKESLRYMIKAREIAYAKHMTDHGPLHAQRVYAICRWLGTIFTLTEYESALLQASALLHDIGMASADREKHNEESEFLVISSAEDKTLPFSTEEAALVGKLCRWHRGKDYNNECIEVCENNKIRVGLLASILRLSDELDLDYRRTDFDSPKDMQFIEKYDKNQLQYHKSVLSILGVRIRADKFSKCFELLIDDIGGAKLQIERLINEILGTPLPFPVKILPTKKGFVVPQSTSTLRRKALICAYCNPHGLLTAVLSKINLKLVGIDAEIICSNKETAAPEIFWKKASELQFKNYELAYFIDLHIDKTTISIVKEIISINIKCKIFISGATLTSSVYISEIIDSGATLFLGDEHVIFYADFLTESMPFWIKVAGACNIDSHVTQKNTNKEIYEASNGLKHAMFKYFANSDHNPIEDIIKNIETDNRKYFIAESARFDEKIKSVQIEKMTFGRVLLIKSTSNIPGRFIYEWIIHHIMTSGCVPYENFEFKTPYVIYPVYRSDGTSMRVLFASYFKNSNTTLPIRCFCSQKDISVGKDNTIWKSYSSEKEALNDIKNVIESINKEYNYNIINFSSTLKDFVTKKNI